MEIRKHVKTARAHGGRGGRRVKLELRVMHCRTGNLSTRRKAISNFSPIAPRSRTCSFEPGCARFRKERNERTRGEPSEGKSNLHPDQISPLKILNNLCGDRVKHFALPLTSSAIWNANVIRINFLEPLKLH